MATEILELQLRVTGASEGATAFKTLSTNATEANARIVDITSSLRFMRQALVAISFAHIFAGLEEGVTASQNILNLLRTVTANGQQAANAFDHFAQLAKDTRAPFQEIAALAVQVSRTIADGPDKLQQTDNIVKNIAESFAVAGANGQSTRNVIRDINEMFAGGTVIMRQFRAILQQDRPLLDAVAKTVVATGTGAAKFNDLLNNARSHGGATGGTLTEAIKAAPGALLGSDVQRSLSGPTKVTEQFAKTTVTLGQALTNLNTQWIAFLQHINDASNGLNFLGTAVQFVADHIPLIVAFAAAIASLLVIDVVLKGFANFGTLIDTIFSAALIPVKLLYGAITGLIAPFITLTAQALLGVGKIPALFASAYNAALKFSTAVVSGVQALISFGAGAVSAVGSAVGLFGDLLAVTGSVGTSLISMASIVASSFTGVLVSAAASLLESLLAIAPAIAGIIIAAVPLAAIGFALYGLVQPLAQVGVATDDLSISFGNIAAVALSTIEVIINNWPLFTRTLSALWTDMINSMMNKLSEFANRLDRFNKIAIDLASGNPYAALTEPVSTRFQTDRTTNSATPLLNDLVAKIKAGIPAAQAQIDKIVGPLQKHFFALIDGSGDTPPAAAAKGKGYDSALSSLENLIAKVDPAQAAIARLAEVQKTFNKAAKEGVDVTGILAAAGLTRADITNREVREVVGAGNADTDLTGKISILNTALANHNITLAEHTRLVRADTEANLKTKFDVGSGVNLAELEEQDRVLNQNAIAAKAVTAAFANTDAQRDYTTTIQALNLELARSPQLLKDITDAAVKAREALLQTKTDTASGEQLAYLQQYQKLANDAAPATTALNQAFSKQNALHEYAIGVQAIADAQKAQALSAEDAASATRDLQIQFLNTQTDAVSGFQRGMLEVQKSMDDLATTASTTVKDAFDNLSDTLTNFFDTGKFDAKKLITDLQHDLTKQAVQGALLKPLADMFQLNGDGSGGAGGIFGNIFGTIFGGGAGKGGLAGALKRDGSSPNAALFVQAAGGLGGGSGGSGGGLLDSLFGGGKSSQGNPSQNLLFGATDPSRDASGTVTGLINNAPDNILNSIDQGGQDAAKSIGDAFSSQQGGGGFLDSLSSLFSSGGGGSGGGGGLGDLFSSIFSSGGGAASGAGAAASGGGFFDGIGSFFSSLGFATSGSFKVGGSGGQDSQLVPLRLTPGEVVNVKHDSDMTQGGDDKAPMFGGGITFIMPAGTNMDTFQRSEGQITARVASAVQRANMRNN